MQIITVASRKGGTGKTTTAGGVAQTLAREGYSVGLIDLDSQCNALSMFAKRIPKEFRVEAWLNGESPAWFDVELPEGVKFQILHGVGGHEGLSSEDLRTRLAALPFDYVVFDTPPADSLMVRSAVEVADIVLALAEPGNWAVAGAIAVSQMVRPEQKLAFVVGRFGSAKRTLDSMSVDVLNKLPHEVFTVANSTSVPVAAGSRAGFPRKGKAWDDLWELMKWIIEEGK